MVDLVEENYSIYYNEHKILCFEHLKRVLFVLTNNLLSILVTAGLLGQNVV